MEKNNLSKLEIAFDFVEKKGKVTFKQIWSNVCKKKNLSEEESASQVSAFYASLLQDGRFVSADGKFDLKARYKFDDIERYDDIIKQMESATSVDDEPEVDEEEIEIAPRQDEFVRNDFGDDDSNETTSKSSEFEEDK